MSYTTFFVLAVFFTVAVNTSEVLDKLKPCGLHESRDFCGAFCEDRCNAVRPAQCSAMKCSYTGCRCKDGYARNPYTKRCVERRLCPRDGCARGEIAGSCGRACEATCPNLSEPSKCQTMLCSDWECRCDLQGGFMRNPYTGKCVQKDEACDRASAYNPLL